MSNSPLVRTQFLGGAEARAIRNELFNALNDSMNKDFYIRSAMGRLEQLAKSLDVFAKEQGLEAPDTF